MAGHLAHITAGDALNVRAIETFDGGRNAVTEVTMAKLYATDLARVVIHDAQQIHGGIGYTPDCWVARMWRDSRLYSIGGGASEIMTEIIARNSGF